MLIAIGGRVTHSEVLQRIADTGECFLLYREAQDLFAADGSLGYLWRDSMRAFAWRYQLDYEYSPKSDERLTSLVRTNGFRFKPIAKPTRVYDYALEAKKLREPEGTPLECVHGIAGPCDLCEALTSATGQTPTEYYTKMGPGLLSPPKDAADHLADLMTDTLDTMDRKLVADPQATEVLFEGDAKQAMQATRWTEKNEAFKRWIAVHLAEYPGHTGIGTMLKVAFDAGYGAEARKHDADIDCVGVIEDSLRRDRAEAQAEVHALNQFIGTLMNRLADAGFPLVHRNGLEEQLDAAIEELHQLRSDKAAAEECEQEKSDAASERQ